MTLLLGLGIIGSRCANQITNAGIALETWNRTQKDRPDFAKNLIESAANADTILCYLRDEHAVREIFSRLKNALKPGTTFINHATIDPATTLWLAEECREISCEFLDCPFTGSRDAAAAGNLVYYCSGKAEILERQRPLLEITSRVIIPLGSPPAATILKIATNLLTASTVQAVAEALAICQAHGIEAAQFQAALQENASNSTTANFKLAAIAAQDHTPHFSTENMLKDVNYSRALAAEKNLVLPGLNATAEQLDLAARSGHAHEDFSSVAELLKPKN